MKKLNILIAMLVMAAATAARADSVKLDWGSPSFGNGGAFSATVYDGPAAGTFSTWCVQTDVYFTPGNTYTYELVQTDSKGRNLALGTAWLYDQFLSGGLTVANSTDAGLFQSAVWWLQGGQTEGGFSPGGAGNKYYDDAFVALGSGLTGVSGGAYGVSIMQMFDASGAPAQAQLARAPDGGATLVLLGSALFALGLLRRKLS